MDTTVNVREYLHNILANKIRIKLSDQEFNDILNMVDEIEKISEKGLLIVTLAEQLQKMSNVNSMNVKKFFKEFLQASQPQKQRKQKSPNRKRRSRPKKDGENSQTLNQMAAESVSNPSNIENPRIGVRGASGLLDQNSRGSQGGSSNIDKNQRDLIYEDQFKKITEQITPFNQDYTNFHDQGMDPERLNQLSNQSSSNSSNSFGLVSNYSQKMNLLEANIQKKPKTVRKPGESTITKKKMGGGLTIDKNLTLQKTRVSMNESFNFSDERSRQVSYQYSQNLQFYRQVFANEQDRFNQFLKNLNDKPLSELARFGRTVKKMEQRSEDSQRPGYMGYQQYDDNINFMSQPLSYQTDEFRSTDFVGNDLSLFKYEDQNPTLQAVSQKVNKPPELIFMEMLKKMQIGQVQMTQDDPANFSQIRLKILTVG